MSDELPDPHCDEHERLDPDCENCAAANRRYLKRVLDAFEPRRRWLEKSLRAHKAELKKSE